MVLADRDQSASLEESCAVPLLCRLALATACDDHVQPRFEAGTLAQT